MPRMNVRGVSLNYRIVGEHGPWVEHESLFLAFVDAHPEQVGGQQVGGELHPGGAQAQRARQRL